MPSSNKSQANDPISMFEQEKQEAITHMTEDHAFRRLSNDWMAASGPHRYTYNFTWLGRPIIQFPQDILALQELIWTVRPDVIVETGIAHGGSLVFSASILELIGHGRVIGVDIDIRAHNRMAIESHVMAKRITMIQGSSIDESIVDRVRAEVAGAKTVLVILDSNHTHAHVAEELRLYTPLVTLGSYAVVMDTLVEDLPADLFNDRPWGTGDNPKTAVHQFLQQNDMFEIDRQFEGKLMISVAPDGYLRRVKVAS